MGNKIVLIGGGGHCKSVIDVLKKGGGFDEIVITDPAIAIGTRLLDIEVVGTDECLSNLRDNDFEYAFITVGSVGINPLRQKLVEKAKTLGFRFPRIIDPSASVADSAVIEEGAFIGKNAVINADAQIGVHCIINSGAIVEHECQVGDFSHISVGAILCGEVEVGCNSFIGAGSTVIQCIRIGDKVVIGANSIVLKNIGDNMKYYGIVG